MQPSSLDRERAAIRRFIKMGAVGALVLIALITFLSSMRSVDTGRVGVVTQYGQVTGRELDEGLSWVLPWGLNNVTEYDIKTQKVETNVAAATKDLQDVNATIVLTYNLNRGKVSEVHQQVGANYQEIDIDPQIQEAFKATTAQFTNQELITKRPEVKEVVLKTLKERVEANGRYNIQDIAITNFTFSAEFNKAIEAVQIANQNVAKAKQELETVRVEAEKQIAEAEARAEAQRLQQQTLTSEILTQEWIKKWNGTLPTYMGGGDSSFLLQIPKAE
jgi:regulator of protease activity HflC (stomatin/prohibitin superfamily)